MFDKLNTFRSEEYMAFVRRLPCCICRVDQRVFYDPRLTVITLGHERLSDPHHVMGGGKAMKCSDLYTIPLCREHHTEHDNLGKISFYEKYDADKWQEVARTLEMFIMDGLIRKGA